MTVTPCTKYCPTRSELTLIQIIVLYIVKFECDMIKELAKDIMLKYKMCWIVFLKLLPVFVKSMFVNWRFFCQIYFELKSTWWCSRFFIRCKPHSNVYDNDADFCWKIDLDAIFPWVPPCFWFLISLTFEYKFCR